MGLGQRQVITVVLFVVLFVLFVLSWVLPRRFGGYGLVAFYLLVLPAEIASVIFELNQRYGSAAFPTLTKNPIGEVLSFSPVSFLICLGLMLPLSLTALRKWTPGGCNPRVSVYCLWLAIAFGAIAITPWHKSGKTGEDFSFAVMAAYTHSWIWDWKPTLVGHSLAAFLLATSAATVHSLVLIIRSKSGPVTVRLKPFVVETGILAGVLVGAGVLIVIFRPLGWNIEPLVVSCAVALLLLGFPVTRILTGVISQRMTAKRQQSSVISLGNNSQSQSPP